MYFNTLIIMNEDALGYGNRSRKPSGYCKLTMPNRVSCYVQGLRQLPKGQIYKLYLTSKSKQQSVEVGMLQVGANGNKETRWVMNPSSINNSGINAEEIDGAFIIVSGDDIKANIVPLVGFSSEPYIWEHLIKDNNKIVNIAKIETQPEIAEKEEREEREEIKEITEETKPMDLGVSLSQSTEEKQVNVVQGLAQDSVQDVIQDLAQDSVQDLAQTREYLEPAVLDNPERSEVSFDEASIQDIEDKARYDEVLSLRSEVEELTRVVKESKQIIEQLQKQATRTQEVAEVELASPEPTNPESANRESKKPEQIQGEPMEPLEKVSGINEYINNFIRRFQAADKQEQRADYTEIGNIFEKRIPINPFQAQNTGIKWVRITHEDLTSFPSLDQEWTNQQLIMDAHRDYKHFILGRDESGLIYYLGIPGIFDPNKESPLNIDKIEKFSCCHNVPPRVNEAGYWIAII